jgi:hypothetical protein
MTPTQTHGIFLHHVSTYVQCMNQIDHMDHALCYRLLDTYMLQKMTHHMSQMDTTCSQNALHGPAYTVCPGNW